jgi:hypothetical protein
MANLVAQTDRGVITGTVKDPNRIPRAACRFR